ncbi:hypothetical protein GGS26DRAFT_214066 [Hypomontagnella submonticulosa]|nr:hypothetical protein GGS26DRAFT_214066 [Hypomontagnella submonticulosa]
MESLVLPQEIILLLCETLAARGDFITLFHCSLVSRRVAIIALQQIYSIQDSAPASTGSTYSKLQWTQLWRSIVLSSLGETAFPYCAYIRTLSLGNLEECIHDIGRDKKLRSIFFGGAMGQFLVPREQYRPNEATSQTPLPLIDYQATMVKCAVSITEYIGNIADVTETAVMLEHLEFTYIPHDILPTMITRLGSLTSLRVRDGSVLGVEAASAISQCCPKFADLTCYY